MYVTKCNAWVRWQGPRERDTINIHILCFFLMKSTLSSSTETHYLLTRLVDNR